MLKKINAINGGIPGYSKCQEICNKLKRLHLKKNAELSMRKHRSRRARSNENHQRNQTPRQSSPFIDASNIEKRLKKL